MEKNQQPEAEEADLSLAELSQAFARLLDRGEPAEELSFEAPADEETEEQDMLAEAQHHASCPISPASILEAMLFVGSGNNQPLTSELAASRMRDVEPEEIDDLVRELNALYEEKQWAYVIESAGGGYRLALREEYLPLREKFYQKLRQARLSQAAVDCLAVVAYHQPITKPQIEEFRDRPCGTILRQLVRRELLRVEKVEGDLLYHTTDRFLAIFGLDSLAELPRTQ